MEREEELLEILDYYSSRPNPTQQDNVIAMLREIQDLLGCIPQGVQQQAADAVGTKQSVISLLVRRFPSLKEAAYRHRITVCSGQRCSGKGAAALLQTLQQTLQVDAQGLSKDGQILLTTQNCLKQCTKGPNLLLNGALHTAMTPEKAKQLVQSLSRTD